MDSNDLKLPPVDPGFLHPTDLARTQSSNRAEASQLQVNVSANVQGLHAINQPNSQSVQTSQPVLQMQSDVNVPTAAPSAPSAVTQARPMAAPLTAFPVPVDDSHQTLHQIGPQIQMKIDDNGHGKQTSSPTVDRQGHRAYTLTETFMTQSGCYGFSASNPVGKPVDVSPDSQTAGGDGAVLGNVTGQSQAAAIAPATFGTSHTVQPQQIITSQDASNLSGVSTAPVLRDHFSGRQQFTTSPHSVSDENVQQIQQKDNKLSLSQVPTFQLQVQQPSGSSFSDLTCDEQNDIRYQLQCALLKKLNKEQIEHLQVKLQGGKFCQMSGQQIYNVLAEADISCLSELPLKEIEDFQFELGCAALNLVTNQQIDILHAELQDGPLSHLSSELLMKLLIPSAARNTVQAQFKDHTATASGVGLQIQSATTTPVTCPQMQSHVQGHTAGYLLTPIGRHDLKNTEQSVDVVVPAHVVATATDVQSLGVVSNLPGESGHHRGIASPVQSAPNVYARSQHSTSVSDDLCFVEITKPGGSKKRFLVPEMQGDHLSTMCAQVDVSNRSTHSAPSTSAPTTSYPLPPHAVRNLQSEDVSDIHSHSSLSIASGHRSVASAPAGSVATSFSGSGLVSKDFTEIRERYLIMQAEVELASLDSIEADIHRRRAEICFRQSKVRSSQNLSDIGKDEEIPQRILKLQRSISLVWSTQANCTGRHKEVDVLHRTPSLRLKKFLEVIFRNIRLRPGLLCSNLM